MPTTAYHTPLHQCFLTSLLPCIALAHAQTDQYGGTREQRTFFQERINALPKEKVPSVAVVSFAAPRVGNLRYAEAMGERTITNPWDVREPFILGALLRDHLPQVSRRTRPQRACSADHVFVPEFMFSHMPHTTHRSCALPLWATHPAMLYNLSPAIAASHVFIMHVHACRC